MSRYAGGGQGAGGANRESGLVQPTRLHELAYELVRRHPGVGRTKLAKLLYLADLEHFCRRGVTLSGAAYVRQKRGPIPVALYQIERDLDQWAFETETTEDVPGYVEVRHRAVPGALTPLFDAAATEIIDLVSSTYGPMQLRDLKHAVYDTEPMRALLELEKETASSLIGKPLDLSRCWFEASDEVAEPLDDAIITEHVGDVAERETERVDTAAALARGVFRQ